MRTLNMLNELAHRAPNGVGSSIARAQHAGKLTVLAVALDDETIEHMELQLAQLADGARRRRRRQPARAPRAAVAARRPRRHPPHHLLGHPPGVALLQVEARVARRAPVRSARREARRERLARVALQRRRVVAVQRVWVAAAA